ncbi:hypothetical protein B5G20_10020 [Collinsella sp. An7]|uniref:ribbon-helix-helix protein, CopG family n=1 Tax=Collinsella sp. An7 TaxID=1965651 RepID=UPI000B3A6704|nr:ribbon-helix-helix protein, CopG family [Collinsella sp. An7]OUN45198.1 hypothetical protein B5G20_10020 [Collinsella sp. An7]
MSKAYVAADGREITEEMIGRWCDAYERGEFPDGERTVGRVVYGRPPLSNEGTAVISIKVPVGMKKAIERKAKAAGVSTSAYARAALSDKLIAVG